MTMTNAEWMLENGMKFSKLSWGYINCRNIVYYCKDNRTVNELYAEKSASPENLITKWLDMDYKEPILDDVEKSYLSAVIKPFRKRVEYISKEEDFDGPFDGPAEFIHIELSDGDIADFPDFKANTMYKGMKLGYEYSLEELGL